MKTINISKMGFEEVSLLHEDMETAKNLLPEGDKRHKEVDSLINLILNRLDEVKIGGTTNE